MQPRVVLIMISSFTWIMSGCGMTTNAMAPLAGAGTDKPFKVEDAAVNAAATPFTVEDVAFTAEDGIALVGKLYTAESEIAVVLAHMATNDQTAWTPFAEQLANAGYTVLTFNFRGYEPSGGADVMDQMSRDTRAAVEFLEAKGYARIVCVGASMGGTACLRTAADVELAGLIVISSPRTFGGSETRVGTHELVNMKLPKLFIASENDRASAESINLMYQTVPDPKQIKIFTGTATHGMDLLNEPTGDEFRNLLLEFLEGLRT